MFGKKSYDEAPAWGPGSAVEMHAGFGRMVPLETRTQGLEWAIGQLVMRGMAVDYATATSAYMSVNKRQSKATAGAVGFLLLGPIGAAAGVVGATDTMYRLHVHVDEYGRVWAETSMPNS